jgi:adenosine deaminase CECR1
MVGSPMMNIHGWRQLAEWSIEFSCLKDSEKDRAMSIFHKEWEDFCIWIDREFGQHADKLMNAS